MTWKPTKWGGVRYREHPERKHGILKDRYYTVQMSARYAHLGPSATQEAVKRLPSLTTGDQAGQGKVATLKK